MGQDELQKEQIAQQVDVDVTNTPAVDVVHPNALSLDTAASVLEVFLASPRCAGPVVTEFNPHLDLDGSLALELADHLAKTLGTARRPRGRG